MYYTPLTTKLVLSIIPAGQEELIERVLLSSMLNPGEQWQAYQHHGRQLSLEYRLRFRCDANYYGPQCNKFCRTRDDFFGHFDCDVVGSKVCKDGWTGPECRQGEPAFLWPREERKKSGRQNRRRGVKNEDNEKGTKKWRREIKVKGEREERARRTERGEERGTRRKGEEKKGGKKKPR